MKNKTSARSRGAPGGTNFLITIHHQQNQSWQGTIQWLDTQKTCHFRSELELLSLMQEAVQAALPDDQSFRDWDDDARIVSIF